MSTSAPVRLVVFDIGGVLVRIVPWDHAHLACGYAEDPGGDAARQLLALLRAHAVIGG